MYRAHLAVYGSGPKPLTIAAIEKSFSPRAVGGNTGTRHGHPGIWVERDTADSFRAAISRLARFALETGYRFEIGCTNAPSKAQADTVTFSSLGRIALARDLIWTARR